LCDPGPLVAQSLELDKPVILVTLNYRLNVFAFGDGQGQRNLALQDQRLAVEWVRTNIASLGGDPVRLKVSVGLPSTNNTVEQHNFGRRECRRYLHACTYRVWHTCTARYPSVWVPIPVSSTVSSKV